MNIVFLDPNFSKTDITNNYGQIPLHLSQLGHNVKILTYKREQNDGIENFDGVRLVKSSMPCLLNFPLLWWILKNKRDIDCVFAYLSLGATLASLLFKLVKRRGLFIVKMDSDGRFYIGNPVMRILKRLAGEVMFRLLARFSELLIIESPDAKQRVIKLHPWLEKKLLVLSNGVNREELAEFRKFTKPIRSRKILYVGRVEYAKGVDLLLKAFSKLKEKYPSWDLELIGKVIPSFKKDLENLTSNLNDKVVIIGYIPDKDLMERYMSAEIFCLPSRREGFSLVLLEAMYFGKAIVSSDAGSAEYMLDYGNAGLIFENEDLDELTTKLEILMKDGNLRKDLANNARKRCKELFDWKKIIKELNTYIKKV